MGSHPTMAILMKVQRQKDKLICRSVSVYISIVYKTESTVKDILTQVNTNINFWDFMKYKSSLKDGKSVLRLVKASLLVYRKWTLKGFERGYTRHKIAENV